MLDHIFSSFSYLLTIWHFLTGYLNDNIKSAFDKCTVGINTFSLYNENIMPVICYIHVFHLARMGVYMDS